LVGPRCIIGSMESYLRPIRLPLTEVERFSKADHPFNRNMTTTISNGDGVILAIQSGTIVGYKLDMDGEGWSVTSEVATADIVGGPVIDMVISDHRWASHVSKVLTP
jgi:hypothetical protein